jgi:uncharacterized protein
VRRVGAHDALAKLGKPLSSIEVLSIGTTSEAFCVSVRKGARGMLGWSTTLVQLLLQAQEAGTVEQVRHLVGRANVMRVDKIVERKRFTLDNARAINELTALAAHAAEEWEPRLRVKFLRATCPPFRPIYR